MTVQVGPAVAGQEMDIVGTATPATRHRGTCFAVEDAWRRMDLPTNLYFVDVEEECVSWQPEMSAYLALNSELCVGY